MIKAIFYIGIGVLGTGFYNGDVTTDDVIRGAELIKEQSVAAYETVKPVAVGAYDYVVSEPAVTKSVAK